MARRYTRHRSLHCLPDADLRAAAELSAAGRRPIVYTFAGPRTGSIEFAARYRNAGIETYRVVNTEDLVPTVPLATIQLDSTSSGRPGLKAALGILGGSGLDYQHVGRSMDFTVNNGTITDNHILSTYRASLP